MFEIDNDPISDEKLVDVVGPYMNPPPNAAVLSVDERRPIRALDRTQSPLPAVNGHPGTCTRDCRRHGAIELCAAFDVLGGEAIGRIARRVRGIGFPVSCV